MSTATHFAGIWITWFKNGSDIDAAWRRRPCWNLLRTSLDLMPDVFTKSKRSQVMSRIRGTGNKDTELRMIQIFRANRIVGWRRNWPLFGKPDFVFPKHRLAVFVDGCFWHGCPLHATKPANNAAFWKKKLSANKARDKLVTRMLRALDWQVLRIWEHDLSRKHESRLLPRLKKLLTEVGSRSVD